MFLTSSQPSSYPSSMDYLFGTFVCFCQMSRYTPFACVSCLMSFLLANERETVCVCFSLERKGEKFGVCVDGTDV